MKRDIDLVLKQALSPKDEPDVWLNRNILYRAEEMTHMAKKRTGRIPAAILTAACTLVIGSAAVIAAARYLTPGQIAGEFEDKKLMDAFQGEDAVSVNETQEYGGFRVTLLGAVSGREISEHLPEDGQGRLIDDMFYAAVAIERADGTPMPSTSDDAYGEEPFYVSPYIKGLDPGFYSLMNFGGGYSEFVQDGIQYRMMEMENIEVFADRGIYIGVSSGTFYDNDAWLFDENTGEIIRNEAYDKVNALFTLPMDPAKGDPAAAEAFLKSMEEDDSGALPEMSELDQEVDEWVAEFEAGLKEGKVIESAERIESTVQTCIPDENGVASYAYDLGDEGSKSGFAFVDMAFPDKIPGTMAVAGVSYSGSGIQSLLVDVVTLNEDGTVGFAAYRCKK